MGLSSRSFSIRRPLTSVSIDQGLSKRRWRLVTPAQWLVGEKYEWRDDPGRCAEEMEWRMRKIWDYDVESMVAQADSAFEERLEALRGGKIV